MKLLNINIVSFIVFVNLFVFFNSHLSYARDSLSVTAQQINRLLKKNRRPSWIAEDNNVFEKFAGKTNPIFGLQLENPRHELSIQADYPKKRYTDMPTSIDWRNFAGQNWITPVKDQGRCGSCVAFATIAAVEAKYNITSLSFDYNLDLSEQHIFSCGGGGCSYGWWASSGLYQVKQRGASDEACFPYLSGNAGNDLQCTLACDNSSERLYFIDDYVGIWNIEDIKEALLNGPVVSTMTVYEDFLLYKSGIYRYITGDRLGGHAITITGYNDDEEIFIVKNSWGKNWGEGGYFRIFYDDISGVGNSGYKIELANVPPFVKIKSPGYRELVHDIFQIIAEANFSEFKKITAIITLRGGALPVSKIQLNRESPNTAYGNLDSTTLEDGIYDLRLQIEETDVNGLIPPNSSFLVLNEDPQISVTMQKDFEGNEMPERAYFTVECSNSKIPLTKFELSISGPGQDKTDLREFPCPLSKIGFRTGMFEPGTYNVSGKGYIGENHIFPVDSIDVVKSKQKVFK